MAQQKKLTGTDKQIIELWEAGYTGQQIGKELSMTRNAVMGRIYRLRRMSQMDYGHKKKLDRPEIKEVVKPAKKLELPNAPPRKISQVLVLPASMVRRGLIKPARKGPGYTLMELKSGMCKYSISGDHVSEYLFCGARVKQGAYCDHHHSICYMPSRPRERGKSSSKPFMIEGRKF